MDSDDYLKMRLHKVFGISLKLKIEDPEKENMHDYSRFFNIIITGHDIILTVKGYNSVTQLLGSFNILSV